LPKVHVALPWQYALWTSFSPMILRCDRIFAYPGLRPFWGRVVERMRVSGWYLLDPRMVRIKFRPLIADSNSASLRA
jgi:hypothetical protein